MMSVALVCFSTLVLAQTQPQERPRVVVLPVTASDPKLAALGASVSEQVQTELGRTRRIDVMGSSDVAAVLGLEHQKQMMGCSDGKNSCLAEVSAALGAPWLVAGNLARAGKATRIDLKLIRARDGKVFWRGGLNFKDESEMFDTVSALVKELIVELNPPAAPPPTPLVTPAPVPTPVVAPAVVVAAPAVSAPPTASPRLAPWLVAGGGAVAGGAGLALVLVTRGQQSQYGAGYVWSNVTASDVANRERSANTTIVVGSVLGAAGAAALLGGVLWGVLGSSSAPVAVAPTGTGLVVGGVW
jgi:TolB-like protein